MKNEPFVLKNEHFLTVEPFSNLNDRLIVGFSTRKKGFSIKPYDSLNLGLHVNDDEMVVIKNRQKLANVLGISLEQWVVPEQVHGTMIKKVTAKDCGRGVEREATALKATDGMYTSEKNILLTSLYADCVPLYFYAPNEGLVGLAHAGWRGTVQNIGQKMIKLWRDKENVSVNSIYVAIGPAISKRCYEVDETIIQKVNEIVVDKELPYEQISDRKYLLNLQLLNKQLLLAAGINREQIFCSNYCTFTEKQLFYSHRRDKITGRMLSFIGIC